MSIDIYNIKYFLVILIGNKIKLVTKSQTCEEEEEHLRISVWHLLKKLLKWSNKKCKNFNIYNIVLF